MVRPIQEPAAGARARRSDYVALIAVCLLAAIYAIYFGWFSLERYWAFQMHGLDMGNMGQAAWNTVHGHPFYFTNMRLPYSIEAWNTTTRLSFHVEALFPVISAVYLVYPHPESLLVLQTVSIAAGAIAVYLLAREVLGNTLLSVAFMIVYCLFPTVEAMNLYEFHPVSLATPLLLFAFLFAWRRRYLPFVLCCLAAMGTKEQIGLTVAMFGLYVALVNRDWAVGIGVALVGAGWALFAALVVEHHYRLPGTKSYVQTRYGYLGHGVRGVITTMLHHPSRVVDVVVTDAKAGYLRELLQPAGFLALFAAPLLLLALPSFGLNLLSQTSAMYSALGDNSAEIVSVVMIASIVGCRTLLAALPPRLRSDVTSCAVAVFLLAGALWDQHLSGFTPLGGRFQAPTIGQHQVFEARGVAAIPTGVPVSTQDLLDPALSSRHYLYLFPDTGRAPNPPLVPANYILLDASGPTYPLTSTEIETRAREFIDRQGWGVSMARDGIILIRKGASSRRIPPAFYSYMRAHDRPQHAMNLRSRGVQIVGYDVRRVDLPNFRIPRLAYTFYARVTRRLTVDLQPVLFERIVGTSTCSSDPLGLAWLPTSRWRPGRTYLVRMAPIETNWDSRAVAHFSVGIVPMARPHFPACPIPARSGHLASAGTLDIAY